MTRTSPFFRPTVCLVVIVGALVVLATFLARPAEVWVSLDAHCEGVVLPVAAEFDFALPDELSAFWVQATLKNLEGLTVDGVPDPRREWKLESAAADPSAPPSIRVLPGSRRSQLRLRSVAGTRLAIRQGTKPARLEWHHSPSGSWSAEMSFFDGRMEASNLGEKRTLEALIRNGLLPATLSLASRPTPAPQLPAYVSLPAPASFSWTAPAAELSSTGTLAATGCRLVSTRSDAVSLAASSGQVEEIRVNWRSPGSLALALDTAEGGTALRVQAAGLARSVREGGRELLPTLFEQLARGAPERRGLFGVSIALLVMAAGIYLKRALEILAKLHLPDPQ